MRFSSQFRFAINQRLVLVLFLVLGAAGLVPAIGAEVEGKAAPLAGGGKGAAGHWAFQKPALPALPKVQKPDWALNPIDRLILARLEKENLAPSPEADRATLI